MRSANGRDEVTKKGGVEGHIILWPRRHERNGTPIIPIKRKNANPQKTAPPRPSLCSSSPFCRFFPRPPELTRGGQKPKPVPNTAMAASLADAAAQEAKGDSAAAIRTYRSICIEASPSQANAQATEAAIAKLCALYTKQHDANALAKMLTELRPFFAVIPKAKTAKLVKNIIDAVAKVPNTTKLQVQLCREQAEWAKA